MSQSNTHSLNQSQNIKLDQLNHSNILGSDKSLQRSGVNIDAKMTLEDSQAVSILGCGQSHNASVFKDEQLQINFRNYKKSSQQSNQLNIIQLPEYPEYDDKIVRSAGLGQERNSDSSTNSDQGDNERSHRNQSAQNNYSRLTEKQAKMTTSITKDQSTIDKIQREVSRSALELINENMNNVSHSIMLQSQSRERLKETLQSQCTDEQQSIIPVRNSLSQFQKKKLAVFGWGLNDLNQAGLQTQVSPRMFGSNNKSVLIPRELKNFNIEPEMIACGKSHTMIVTKNDELWALGSNQNYALGLSDKFHDTYQNELIKIQTNFEDEVATINCGDDHTVIQLKNGKIYGCGLNTDGQLGLLSDVAIVKEFTPILCKAENINSISCGPRATVFLDIMSQKLYHCGQKSGDTQFEVSCTSVYEEIQNDPILVVKQGSSCTIALSISGKVYMRHFEEPFSSIDDIKQAQEINACDNHYAILTKDNKIFSWTEGHDFVFKELESSFADQVQLNRLSVGHDFGHVIDQDQNLYGWGENQNGELGTSDSYPRNKLSQVRIFNEDQHYMRCLKTFAGHEHVIAVFESTDSPNGIMSNSIKNLQYPITYPGSIETVTQLPKNESLTHIKPPTQQSMARTFSGLKPAPPMSMVQQQMNKVEKFTHSLQMSSPTQLRREQYLETQCQISKYREQANSYRENAIKLREQLSTDARVQPLSHVTSLKGSNHGSMPPKARSIGPPVQNNMRFSTSQPKFEVVANNIYEQSKQNFSFLPSKRDTSREQLMSGHDTGFKSHSNKRKSGSQVTNDQQDHLMVHDYEDHSQQHPQIIQQEQEFKSSFGNAYKDQYTSGAKEQVISQRGRRSSHNEEPPTFASIQNQQTESFRTHKDNLEHQIKNGQRVIAFSRSQRSSVGARSSFSPKPNSNRGYPNNQAQNDYNSYQNINFQNQKLKPQEISVSTNRQNHPKSNLLSNDDTYDLSQSVLHTNGEPLTKYSQPMASQDISQMSSQLISYMPDPRQGVSITSPTDTLTVNQTSKGVSQRAHGQSQFRQAPHHQHLETHTGHSPSRLEYNAQQYKKARCDSRVISGAQNLMNVNLTTQNDDQVAKLNKYKRKLKKYISRNHEFQNEVSFFKEQAEHLQEQNDRIMRCQHMDEERVRTFMEVEEKKVNDLTQMIHQERFEKNQTVASLTQENVRLVGELQERDHKHQVLEKKMSDVHEHVGDVTKTLNTYLQDNMQIQEKNEELEIQMGQQETYIGQLETQLDQTNNNQGQQDKTLHMMKQEIQDLINQLGQRDQIIAEKDHKLSQLKAKRKTDKKVSHDLELTVKDLRTQLEQNMQHVHNLQHVQKQQMQKRAKKEHKFKPDQNLRTTNDSQDNFTTVNQVESNPWMDAQAQIYRTQQSFNKGSVVRQKPLLSDRQISSPQFDISQVNQTNMFSAEVEKQSCTNSQYAKSHMSYQGQPVEGPRHNYNSNGNSSRITNQNYTGQKNQQYAPDFTLHQRNQIGSVHEVNLPMQVDQMRGINPDQQMMMAPQNMMVIDDFQANKSESQHHQTGENSRRGFKTSQRQSKRAKSGPTNSEAARYKLIHQQAEVPDYFNNEDQNSFNTLFHKSHGMKQPTSKSSLAHQSFPNLSYVHARYYNQDKQQFQDNQEIIHHHQLYSQPRLNYPSGLIKDGLISPVPMTTNTYGTKRSEHRMVGMLSEVIPKGNVTSQVNLQNQSTRYSNHNAGIESNFRSNDDLHSLNNNQMSKQNMRIQHLLNDRSNSRSPPAKKSKFEEELTESQRKQAYLMFKEAQMKQSPIPQQIMKASEHNFVDEALVSKPMSQLVSNNYRFDTTKDQQSVEDYRSKTPISVIERMNINESMGASEIQPDNSCNISALSYKDAVLSKMTSKVSKIESILKNKKERLLQKEEAMAKKKADRENIQSQQTIQRSVSMEPITTITESTIGKLNQSLIMKDQNIALNHARNKSNQMNAAEQFKMSGKQDNFNRSANVDMGSKSMSSVKVDRRNQSKNILNLRESYKSWEANKRDKSNNSQASNSDVVSKTNKDALRNLSQELKRKMTNIKEQNQEEDYVKNLYN